MFRKMMLALVLCGLTTGVFAQGGKMETKDPVKGKMEKKGPARDAKGRFIKKDKTDGKMPARDAKGRFIKKGTPDMKMKGKTLPPRDPKTGRFMKKGDAAKMAHDKKPMSGSDTKKK